MYRVAQNILGQKCHFDKFVTICFLPNLHQLFFFHKFPFTNDEAKYLNISKDSLTELGVELLPLKLLINMKKHFFKLPAQLCLPEVNQSNLLQSPSSVDEHYECKSKDKSRIQTWQMNSNRTSWPSDEWGCPDSTLMADVREEKELDFNMPVFFVLTGDKLLLEVSGTI